MDALRPARAVDLDRSVPNRANQASQALFITNPVFREPAFGAHHPLAIRRHASVLDLCGHLGWLDGDRLETCPLAGRAELEAFHTPAYLDAFAEASASGRATRAVRERFGLGSRENPLFPGLHDRAAATVGGAILAARRALAGRIAYHPAGGTHHGRPDRASGFCYFNDPVFAILTLLDAGVARVLYADLDAHHGDGVEDAFATDDRVLTLSVHERDRWPFTGAADGNGARICNLPVPAGFNDTELAFLMDAAVLPRATRFAPEAVVVTCGADALAGDPLSRLALSNGALWEAVLALTGLAGAAVVLGGGGYNPWTVARCWSGLWGRLAGHPIPATLPAEATQMLAGLACDLVDDEEMDPHWLTTLEDARNEGAVRAEIEALARAVG
ncbi:MAG: hypothetical protein MI824_12295 [Hyphomicrobiales bacterium]|nr:hypothetical protein [Hyphomicrobiales bacterium]